MQVVSDPQDIIDRADVVFLNSERNCRFVKPLSKIRLCGMEIGPFQSGAEARVPNWAIDFLLAEGIIEISEEDHVESNKRLRRLAYDEEHNTGLQPLPRILYSALRQRIRYLESDKTSLDPARHEEIQKTRDSLRSLVASRIPKLIRAAWSEVEKSGTIQLLKGRMSGEERWLCEELVILLARWLRGVQGSHSSV